MNRNELLEKVNKELPFSPGVYIMKNEDDEVIYVGKAKALKRRVKSYFDGSPKTNKTYALVSKIDHFDYILTNSELDAFSLESNLIKKYKPKYNILLKDDKSFPYLKIDTSEKYPRLQIVRRPKPEKNVLLFGPYVTGTRIGELVTLIKSAYPIRWCNHNFNGKPYQSKPCLHGQIGDCLAPCISSENEKEYLKVIDGVVDFLNGNTGEIKRRLREKMDNFSKQLKFEEALVIRNQLGSVENMDKQLITSIGVGTNADVIKIASLDDTFAVNVMTIRSGKNVGQFNVLLDDFVGEKNELILQFISSHYISANMLPKELILNDIDESEAELLQVYLLSEFGKVVKITIPKISTKLELLKNCEKNALDFLTHSKERIEKKKRLGEDALVGLKELLKLEKLDRIEGYDISNISGKFSVASMVVFEGGEPARKEYRKFKIKTVIGPDDFASMREVLSRRLTDFKEGKKNFDKKPDLILIDGGFGQLHSAHDISVSLGLEIPMISLAEREEEICTLDSNETIKLSKTNNILKLLQRIRDESHRFAIIFHRNLRSKSIRSSLLEVDGVGESKVRELMKHFKSVDAIMNASEKELQAVQGIGKELASVIYKYYHEVGV